MGNTYLPSDPLARFVDLYETLNADRGWWQDASCLRFAAMAAVTCPGEPTRVAEAIRGVATDIGDREGWFGDLRSPLRFIVSALLVLNEDNADEFLSEVQRVRKMFRTARLRRGGIYETMAVLILRITGEKMPVTTDIVARFQAIYEEMKRHHWWLTGMDDFPACAMLVSQPETPTEIGGGIEEIYQQLYAAGFKRGDPLQTAANLLYLARLDPRAIAERYRSLADSFRAGGARIGRDQYDELAILSFLKQRATLIVERVLSYQTEIRQLKPKPDRSLAFNLASSVGFLDLVQMDENLKEITDAKALMDMQSIINAQQAAAASAAATAACVATTTSTS